jgi:uncharacterized membrane protein YhaH (DUF805 family)
MFKYDPMIIVGGLLISISGVCLIIAIINLFIRISFYSKSFLIVTIVTMIVGITLLVTGSMLNVKLVTDYGINKIQQQGVNVPNNIPNFLNNIPNNFPGFQ